MVERRLLTREFVRAATPPPNGERWVADTKLKGFGLRLWSTPGGVGKAFGLRISNKQGKKIRKTFGSSKAWVREGGRWRGIADHDLSERLEQARRWARDEIDIAKGRLTLEQDRQRRREQITRRLQGLTLERAAHRMLDGMLTEGCTQAYVDRLNKLFALHIPKRLKLLPLNKVPPKELAHAIAGMAIRGGNLRTLRSFVGQLYDRAASLELSRGSYSEELSEHFWTHWQLATKLPFPELRHLKRDDYDRIFERLEAEEDRWQQALCIRLFFMLGAPMSRLMRARWWQILDDKWFPYLPEEKVYWFESLEHLKDDAIRVLGIVKARAKRSRMRSSYWFPSPTRGLEPISTVKGFWRDTLESVGSRYYPLGEFAHSFRQPNNPSYAMTVVRQYGPMFREMHNAAKVSKELCRRAKYYQYSIT